MDVTVGDGVVVGVHVSEPDGVAVKDGVGVTEGEGDVVHVPEGEGDTVRVADGVGVGAIRRTRPPSAKYIAPVRSNANPPAPFSSAAVAGPPSPAKPATPVPAKLEMTPSVPSMRMR